MQNVKISIIGGGNVGATLAQRILESNIADVVLLDILKSVVEGKSEDLMHAAPIMRYKKTVIATNDYNIIKGSSIIVITAGFARQPGMSRIDLATKNSEIMKEVVININKFCPNAIIITVTNPLDLMTYIAYKIGNFERQRIMGMAGVLDTSRFVYIISKTLNIPYDDIETIVLGEHGPRMIPVISQTRVRHKPITEIIDKEQITKLKIELQECGSRIVKLLQKGSAYYAPSAAIFSMIKAIINDEKKLMPVSCIADGEYKIKDVCIGLPVLLGRNGIEEYIKLDLDASELESIKKSAEILKRQLQEIGF